MRTGLLVVVLLASWTVWAECAKPEGAQPGSVAMRSDAERLKFLASRFEDESAAARRWTLGWGGGYAALTMVQLAIAPLFPAEERPDWYWGALSTAVGVAFTILDPLQVLYGGPVFASRAASVMPDDTCALIAEGEKLLLEGAAHETSGTRWYIHVANVAFNVGLGLVLGLGYGRWTSGLINMAVGTAIGEATIFTSPVGLISAWEQYRLGGAPAKVSWHLVPAAGGPGVGVLLRF